MDEGDVLGVSRTPEAAETVEETSVDEGEVLGARRAAQTADHNHATVWFTTLACATVALGGCALLRKKEKKQK